MTFQVYKARNLKGACEKTYSSAAPRGRQQQRSLVPAWSRHVEKGMRSDILMTCKKTLGVSATNKWSQAQQQRLLQNLHLHGRGRLAHCFMIQFQQVSLCPCSGHMVLTSQRRPAQPTPPWASAPPPPAEPWVEPTDATEVGEAAEAEEAVEVAMAEPVEAPEEAPEENYDPGYDETGESAYDPGYDPGYDPCAADLDGVEALQQLLAPLGKAGEAETAPEGFEWSRKKQKKGGRGSWHAGHAAGTWDNLQRVVKLRKLGDFPATHVWCWWASAQGINSHYIHYCKLDGFQWGLNRQEKGNTLHQNFQN